MRFATLPAIAGSLLALALHAGSARAATETVLHAFGGPGDGANPIGGLINVQGTFYGVTDGGGAAAIGAVYSITPDGVETVLHSFGATPGDGAFPRGLLRYSGGTFYGVTLAGGAFRKGTVYSMTPAGVVTVLHSFGANLNDGLNAYSPPIRVGGVLFGTTRNGGRHGAGTVYTIDAAGTERIVYSFGGRPSDVTDPWDGLIAVGGKLYGVGAAGAHGRGGVFSITTAGVESVVYSFAASGDGAAPDGPLINVGGTLYGATATDTTGRNGGTVYSVTPGGVEAVLHVFGGTGDGSTPLGRLRNVAGTPYGATAFGGASGFGTVFAFGPTGSYSVVHSFAGGLDGRLPIGGIASAGGIVYAATEFGGAFNGGTMVAITP